jgi:hypothetical protein
MVTDTNQAGASQASRRWAGGMASLALAALAFCWGRYAALPQAAALPPTPGKAKPAEAVSEASQRWVAVIYGNEPITREDLADYLIARFGDKLELLVNKRIIEHKCKEKGIEVTAAEIDASLAEDLKGMGNLPIKDFVDKVLKRYNKTLYEWKEDVIRPKLEMTKLCRDRVRATDKDFEDAFQAYYGEKVDCRIILFPKEEKNQAMMAYGKMRDNDEEFDRFARQQPSHMLAAKGGKIDPFARHTTGNDELEKEAFSLHPGEVSRMIETPQGFVYLKCDRHLPANTTKKLQEEKPKLEKEIIDKKIQQEMGVLFKEMLAEATPKLFLKKYTTEEELIRDVQREIQPEVTPAGGASPKPPNK